MINQSNGDHRQFQTTFSFFVQTWYKFYTCLKLDNHKLFVQGQKVLARFLGDNTNYLVLGSLSINITTSVGLHSMAASGICLTCAWLILVSTLNAPFYKSLMQDPTSQIPILPLLKEYFPKIHIQKVKKEIWEISKLSQVHLQKKYPQYEAQKSQIDPQQVEFLHAVQDNLNRFI